MHPLFESCTIMFGFLVSLKSIDHKDNVIIINLKNEKKRGYLLLKTINNPLRLYAPAF